jgi:hypothetical protein
MRRLLLIHDDVNTKSRRDEGHEEEEKRPANPRIARRTEDFQAAIRRGR